MQYNLLYISFFQRLIGGKEGMVAPLLRFSTLILFNTRLIPPKDSFDYCWKCLGEAMFIAMPLLALGDLMLKLSRELAFSC
jgi:hypothetical protein